MSRIGLLVVLLVLVGATVFGLVRRQRTGRLRERAAGGRLTAAELGSPLGSRATLVQFSSAFCRPCVATRQVLGTTAAAVDGVAHVEIDAEANLELVRRLGVASTPTTLVLDARGVERSRATGVPRRAEVLTALNQAVDA